MTQPAGDHKPIQAALPPKKKRKKKPRPVADYLFYLLVRSLAIFLQLWDIDTALRVARWLGRGLFTIYGRGRERALENLRFSYPDKDTAWIETTARRSFEHLVMFAFDILYAARLVNATTWRRYIVLNDPHIREVLADLLAGKGMIMVTGHYGNFEILARAFTAFGLESYNVARPIDNPYINHYVYHVLHRGQHIIYKKGATDAMQHVLNEGATLGIVADQNAGHKDIFVPFFGRLASTYKSVGLLAMTYNVPICVGCARRVGDRFRFELAITRIIRPHEWRDRPDPLYWVTAEYTRAIETFVRHDPEQYWWIHRRWKTRPLAERKF